MALELTQPASLRRHARKLIAAGLVVMVIAALDPLEGSILLVVGGILLVLGALLRASGHLNYLYWWLGIMAVAALWGLSAIGGVRALREDRPSV